MAIIKIRNAAIDLDAAEIPNLPATKITSGTLGADRIPSLAASKIGSGTFADARIASSNVSQHATSFDDNKIVNDISTLAIRQASNENKGAYNTNSMFVDVFQDSSGILSHTTSQRSTDEYVSSKVLGTLAEYDYNNASTKAEIQFQNFVDPSNNSYYEIDSDGDSGHSSTRFVTPATALASNTYGGYTNQLGDSTYFQIDYKATKTFTTRLKIGKNGTYGDIYSFKISYSTDGSNYSFLDCSNVSEYAIERGNGSSSGGNFNANTGTSGGIVTFADCGARSVTHVSTLQGIPSFQARYIKVSPQVRHGGYANDNAGMAVFAPYTQPLTTSATGNFISNAITAPSSVSKMGAIVTYENTSGTNTLNTDIVLQLSADNGSNFTTATMTAMPDFATGIKMAKVNDLSVTAGTQLKYKISIANQSLGSKEARIRGVSLQY